MPCGACVSAIATDRRCARPGSGVKRGSLSEGRCRLAAAQSGGRSSAPDARRKKTHTHRTMCVGLGGHGLDAVVAAVKKKGAGRTFTYARGALLQRVFAPPPLALGASHPTPCPRECAFRACTHTTRRYWGTARGGGGVRGCTPGANQLQLLLSTKHMRAQAAHGRPVLLERARPWSPRGRFWEPRTEARTARGLHHIHCMTLAQHCTPQLMPPPCLACSHGSKARCERPAWCA